MDTTEAVKLFRNNWFRRNEEHLELTPAEEQLIIASLGQAPKRWSGAPDVERMEGILAGEQSVLERIGAQLLQVVIGMKGCGPAVQLLLGRDVPLEIEATEYNVLHEAAWGGMTVPSGPCSRRVRPTRPVSRYASRTPAGRTISPSCIGLPGADTRSLPNS